MIVAEESYETSEPTIESHIVKLKSIGRRRLSRLHESEIRRPSDQEDGGIRLEASTLSQRHQRFHRQRNQAAGFENAQNIISSVYLKDPSATRWRTMPASSRFNQFLSGYFPEGRGEILAALCYTMAQTWRSS